MADYRRWEAVAIRFVQRGTSSSRAHSSIALRLYIDPAIYNLLHTVPFHFDPMRLGKSRV